MFKAKLAAVLLAALVVNPAAVSEPVENQTVQVGNTEITFGAHEEAPAEVKIPDPVTIDGTVIEFNAGTTVGAAQPRVLIYSETLNGQQAYTAIFACVPANGTGMDFTIVNTGTETFNVSAYVDEKFIGTATVPVSSDPYVITSRSLDTTGLNGTYKFVFSTASPNGIYCTMAATQFFV